MSSKTKPAGNQDAKPALTPKLRFPEFRDASGWKEQQLGNVCKISTGKKDANEGAADGLYPFFTCAENHIYSHSYSFDAEAILIAGNANVGQTRYYHGKFEAYQRTYVLTDFSGISVPYLYAILNAKLRASLLSQVQVSAMSYIKLPMLQEFGLAVPPTIPEQQKIAECLTTLDEVIAAQSQKLDALKTHKKGLMQQLFPREGETLPRLRFPEFQDAPEWAVREIATFAKVTTGGQDTQNKIEGGAYPFFVRSQTVERINSYSFDGEAVLTSGDGVGVGKNYHYIEGKFDFHQRVYCIYDFDECVSGLFFYLYFSEHFNERVMRMSAKNSVDSVRMAMITEMPVLMPSLAEQQRIATCLTTLDDLITAQSAKLSALKTHKRGLMQQLFPSPEEVEP